MRPGLWHPPMALAETAQTVANRIKRAKLFLFLRQVRHALFDAAFQQECGALDAAQAKGHPPMPPTQLCLATILQADTGASDDAAIDACVMDRRWQLVLDCLDGEQCPLAPGTGVAFRGLLIGGELAQRLVERTQPFAPPAGRVESAHLERRA